MRVWERLTVLMAWSITASNAEQIVDQVLVLPERTYADFSAGGAS